MGSLRQGAVQHPRRAGGGGRRTLVKGGARIKTERKASFGRSETAPSLRETEGVGPGHKPVRAARSRIGMVRSDACAGHVRRAPKTATNKTQIDSGGQAGGAVREGASNREGDDGDGDSDGGGGGGGGGYTASQVSPGGVRHKATGSSATIQERSTVST